ncbi:MAG TPA: signal recognition particle-docking protein FtsY [Deltaproteobacteria bacterium]|nr:signal recognition particle-docking protein FtsY [Deltaproteobacteria bacterium]
MVSFHTMKGLLRGIKGGLARTHNAIMGGLESAFASRSREDLLEAIEETLIVADVGAQTAVEIVDGLRESVVGRDMEKLKARLRERLVAVLSAVEAPLQITASPFVVMVLGVNGVGKTTTIGKLASRLAAEGRSVVLGACDTFRAAAIEQLELWGERAGVPVIKQTHGADPGAVAFDAVRAAKNRGADVVILDTAGRLHTKVNLMEELKKVRRVVSREIAEAPHENLLVLDATTGQNALSQARLFNDAVGVTGLALTKLDGTAKGGILVALARELAIPVRFVGVGEKVEDLRPFSAAEFVEALV